MCTTCTRDGSRGVYYVCMKDGSRGVYCVYKEWEYGMAAYGMAYGKVKLTEN